MTPCRTSYLLGNRLMLCEVGGWKFMIGREMVGGEVVELLGCVLEVLGTWDVDGTLTIHGGRFFFYLFYLPSFASFSTSLEQMAIAVWLDAPTRIKSKAQDRDSGLSDFKVRILVTAKFDMHVQ